MGAYAALVRRTPLIPSPLDGVWLKLECLQRTSSFKLRGAALRLDALDDAERARGVVAASAGNHGQGVALAGQHLGIAVEVCVPRSAPLVKRAAIAAYGATVVEVDGGYDQAEAAARARAAATRAVFVSPFDDALIMRGNGGLLAEEILQQAPDVARIVVPVGGGGLVAGIAEALVGRGVSVVGVQPSANCAMRRSLELGRALTVYDGEPTLAEGCEGAVAESTFAIVQRFGVEIQLVSEPAIRRAMAWAYRACGVIVEASAAVPLAGLLEGSVPGIDGKTVVVVSGGNVEASLIDEVLRG